MVEFARPHTIIGTSLAATVFYTLAASRAGVHDLRLLVTCWLAGLCVNVYVVGINQITDVDIDKINKPYLPLASGAFSMRTGYAICAVTGFLSLAIAACVSPYLLATISIVFIIGTAYSVPPLRLKRYPFFAAASITLARAIVFHCGMYLTFVHKLTGEASIPPSVCGFTGFMFLFVIVIALMKDVPDIEGDRKHNIPTFVANLGPRKVMTLCRCILSVAYTGMIAAALAGLEGVSVPVCVASHSLALSALWYKAAGCNDESQEESYAYYMFIWKLFYFEFASFTLAVMIAGSNNNAVA